MNREIIDFKDLKIGDKYLLTLKAETFADLSTEPIYHITTFKEVLSSGYVFYPISEQSPICINNFNDWIIHEYVEIKQEPKTEEVKPSIEVVISGVDTLLDITDKPSILNLSLYGIISEGGTITIRKAKE